MALSTHPVDVGIRSEAAILLELTRLGVPTWTPFSFNSRADALIEIGGRILRVQIKTGRLRDGVVSFSTKSVRTNSRGWHLRHYVGEIDLFAVHCPALDENFAIPIEDACRGICSLRVVPARNNQSSRVRWASDYRLRDFSPE